MSHDEITTKTRRPILTRLWQRLSRLVAKFTTSVLIRFVLPILPIEQAVHLKESIHCIGTLDYSRSPISMRIDSRLQISRLDACRKEPETVHWIESCLRPGEVFYDIGANVGAYSFVAYAATGGNCQIYAFEPSFSTFAALCQNIHLNRCQDKIIALQVALSGETKMLAFKYISLTPGDAYHALGEFTSDNNDIPAKDISISKLQRMGRDFYVGKDAQTYIRPVMTQPILCYRLDDLIREFGLPYPNHIKLDVDGPEMDILKGAQETLGNPKLRSILAEIDPQAREEIIAYLGKWGFRVQALETSGLKYRQRTVNNMIFVRENSSLEQSF